MIDVRASLAVLLVVFVYESSLPHVGPGTVSKWGKCLSYKVRNLWRAKTRICPHCFQTGCRRSLLNVALVFLCLVLCFITFLLTGECVLLLFGFVFPYQAKRLAWRTCQDDLFCIEWDVEQQLSQSLWIQ